jgi:hypothetical protein
MTRTAVLPEATHVSALSERTDGTFSRSDFVYDPERDLYGCPGGKELRKYRRNFSKPRDGVLKDGRIGYRAIQRDCNACALKPKCCPNMPARKIERSIHEAARDKSAHLQRPRRSPFHAESERRLRCSSPT